MIQVDLPVAFGSGTLLAAALEHHTGARTWPYLYQRALAKNLIFQTLFALWLPVYLLVNYFGFQTSHMFWHGESLTDYPALLPVFLILYFAANIAGFHDRRMAGAARTRQAGAAHLRRRVHLLCPLDGVAALSDLELGTFEEWKAGTARWIWTDTWFMGVLAVGALVFFVGITAIYRSLKQEAIEAAPLIVRTPARRPIRASRSRSADARAARRSGDRPP